jgi:tetratricopeptide (TPR) repeat protein
MERRTSESLIELIDSGQFLTAEEIFSERRTDDPMEMVIRAEVALYFDRLDDALGLLEQVGLRITDVEVAARFSLTRGLLALTRGEDAEANDQLQAAYHFYRFRNEPYGLSKSLLALARASRRRSDLEDATTKLERAQNGITGRTSKRTEYLRGLILSEQAAVAAETGDVDRAAEFYTEAARLLKTVERGRFQGLALVGLADLKCALGEFQESLELYKEAITVFERYDLKRLTADCQLRLAYALIRLGKHERAEKLAQDSFDMSKGDPYGETAALAMLSRVSLDLNRLDEGIERGKRAVEAASREESAEAKALALVALGAARLTEREFKEAAEFLSEAAQLAHDARRSLDIQRLELQAVIHLAEAYHHIDTRSGREQLTRASGILNSFEDAWLADEFNRVSAKYEEQIVFTDDNRLVFDGNQLPRWQEAKRTLEGFLLRNALRQTNNSLTRAARKLGVSKVHVHNLKKKHNM